jgi:large subunit ribosomal protein L29
MDTKELRGFSKEELTSRVKQWQEQLFRARFQAQSTEKRDTSVAKKLRRDVARALTLIREKDLAAGSEGRA